MQDDVTPLVPVRRGKKPTAPEHIKVYRTAVFKVHNPLKHKRAMLADSMKRTHLAYTRLLAHLLPDVERFAGMTKKDRNAEMQTRIYRFVRPLPLGQAAKAGIRIDVQGQRADPFCACVQLQSTEYCSRSSFAPMVMQSRDIASNAEPLWCVGARVARSESIGARGRCLNYETCCWCCCAPSRAHAALRPKAGSLCRNRSRASNNRRQKWAA